MFNQMELSQISLESVLIVIIVLISLNLIFIGFYIVSVLRELRKTVVKARQIMEDVDRSVKDGVDKVISIERPLQALAATTNALAGLIKGAEIIKKATNSILWNNSNKQEPVDAEFATLDDLPVDQPKKEEQEESPFKMNAVKEEPLIEEKPQEDTAKKPVFRTPRFFKPTKK
jgi:uncharacterized protein YoxC